MTLCLKMVLFFTIRQLFTQCLSALIGTVWTPARRHEDVFYLVRKIRCALYVVPQRGIFMKGDPDQIVCMNIGGDAVDRFFIVTLFGKSAQQPVPYDKYTSVISVQIADI